ncbi:MULTISPECIES: hypothetical protein [unclassified Streptomyces]|uniref:hypothetical protein n=1 Tax=unclassified Streptomyces TaxID=2593676 RepID=UPI001F1A45BB|nr:MULTISPECIES: hypothetical protein [unclassified Streptomyces]MCF0086599.1 hypothetical protein [Streptomyces sp. MH192]MCF0098753.1 hypothetical protein [Streptomyces sp. MH191]
MPDLKVTQYAVHPALGRHLVLDARSLAYRRPYHGQTLRPTEWAPKAPVLDQQNLIGQGIHTSRLFDGVDDVDALGSCTANSATALISVLHDADTLAKAGLDVSDPAAAEEWAIGLYADATARDEWLEYTWPADDCGSSGLGVAKALKDRGLVDEYVPATTALELCALLQKGPLLLGMPWHEAFFTPPGRDALLDDLTGWQRSPVAGGHEVCVVALETVRYDHTGGLDEARTILRIRNSWSPSWGDDGCFRMSLAIYQALRKDIDLVQPRLTRT